MEVKFESLNRLDGIWSIALYKNSCFFLKKALPFQYIFIST